MLDQIKLNKKTYNEIFQKALATIPVLSNEWTDYNYSDPGITTLQVLSIVKLYQQSYLDRLNDDIRMNMIKFLGYDIEGVKPSLTNIEIESENDIELYANGKIRAGDIIFETCQKENITSGKLSKIVIYDKLENKYIDISNILLSQLDSTEYVFGKEAKEDSKIYLLFTAPLELGKAYSLYIEMDEEISKNQRYIPREKGFDLCDIRWEIFTDDGWSKINVDDYTKGLIQSERILINIDHRMILQNIKGVGEGYIVRGILKRSAYEISPKIKKISVNVFDVSQRDTKAKSFVFDSDGKDVQVYVIENFMTVYDKIVVLVKDGKNNIYYEWKDSEKKERGYFCKIFNRFDGRLEIRFDKEKFDFVPIKGKNVVKVICYSEELDKKLDLKVYGFEKQIIKLGSYNQIISEEFKLMIKIRNYKGKEYFYDIDGFVGNNRNDKDEIEMPLKYRLNVVKNELEILRVSVTGDMKLVITDLVLSEGKNGNIRKGELNCFDKELLAGLCKSRGQLGENKNFIDQIKIKNIYSSYGGKNVETIDDVILKIINDISSTHSLVTKEDIETKIFEIPGLSIHKVKAICNSENNSISIIVKPNSDKKFPILSEKYREIIIKSLEKYRLITTKLNIVSPVYVAINVSGIIYIKPNYKGADKIIRDLIYSELNGLTTDKDFGREIVYGDLYSKIENLSCVDMIYSLSLDSQSPYAIKDVNSNIKLYKNGLSYMGDYNMVLNNNIKMVI